MTEKKDIKMTNVQADQHQSAGAEIHLYGRQGRQQKHLIGWPHTVCDSDRGNRQQFVTSPTAVALAS